MPNTPKENKTYELNEMSFGPDTGEALNYDPRLAKVMISIRVDGDVLKAFKARAAKTDEGYQTLMNEALRSSLKGAQSAPFTADEVASLRSMISAGRGPNRVKSTRKSLDEFKAKHKSKARTGTSSRTRLRVKER